MVALAIAAIAASSEDWLGNSGPLTRTGYELELRESIGLGWRKDARNLRLSETMSKVGNGSVDCVAVDRATDADGVAQARLAEVLHSDCGHSTAGRIQGCERGPAPARIWGLKGSACGDRRWPG